MSLVNDMYAYLLSSAGGQDYVDTEILPKYLPAQYSRKQKLSNIIADNNDIIDESKLYLKDSQDLLEAARLIDDPYDAQNAFDEVVRGRQNAYNRLKKAKLNNESYIPELDTIDSTIEGAAGVFANNPLKTKATLADGTAVNPLKNTGTLAAKYISAHPLAAAGMGALGVANIAGLTDDDKIGGQLVGGLGGGLLASTLNVNPVAKLAIGMGGGALGSLFDKLRAKKEAEQQAVAQQYAQY